MTDHALCAPKPDATSRYAREVASFSFRAGNAGKILRLPLFAAGRVLTLLIPRGRRWIFGCGAGVGDGALAMWHVVRQAGHDAVWLTGSPREAADAAALGIPTLDKHSVRGWWATARAGVVVITHGFGDANRYAISGAFVVQLWHGIPLKRLGLDSPVTSQSALLSRVPIIARLLRGMYWGAAQRINVLPAASHRSRGRLESAFGLSSQKVLVTGEPRVDVLSELKATERRHRAISRRDGAVGQIPKGARVLLYAPTWRDGARDPAVPDATQWRLINELLVRHNAVLLVRSHPLGEGDYTDAKANDADDEPRVRLVGASVLADITPVLPAIDVLITDYSSLAFDVGLLAMPVVYLAPDPERYAQQRGFYGAYEDVAGDDFARTWQEAVEQLDELLSDASSFAERAHRSSALSAEMHAYRDGKNAERVYEALRSRGVMAARGAA